MKTFIVVATQHFAIDGRAEVEAATPEAAKQIVEGALAAVKTGETTDAEDNVLAAIGDDMVSYIRDCGTEDVCSTEWTFDSVEDEDDSVLLTAATFSTAKYECGRIQCGATFEYLRVSCGKTIPPVFCPQCGGAL
jgi:hypothetical protein